MKKKSTLFIILVFLTGLSVISCDFGLGAAKNYFIGEWKNTSLGISTIFTEDFEFSCTQNSNKKNGTYTVQGTTATIEINNEKSKAFIISGGSLNWNGIEFIKQINQ